MDWKETIRNNINDGEFSPQKDWEDFSAKYHRFKTVKRLKYFSAVVATVVVVGLIGYYFTQQHTLNENITKSKNRTEKPLIVKNLVENNQNNQNGELKQTSKGENTNIQDANFEENKSNNQIAVNHESQVNETNDTNNTVNDVDENSKSEVVKTNIPKTIQKLVSANFSTDNQQGCGSFSVRFFPEEISDSVIYLWEFGDGSFSNEKTPDHFYKNAGTYTVSLTTKHFFCNKLNQKIKKDLIIVKEKPKADFSYKCFSGKEVQLNNLSTDFEQCQWFLDGYAESTDLSPRFSMEEGNHEILLLVSSQGCTDSVGKTIIVIPEIKIFFPTAFTPDGDGQNDEFKPVFSSLPDSYKILIFDRLGKIIFSSEVVNKGWDGKINGMEPKAGLYQWKIVYQCKNIKPVEKSGQVKLIVK